MFDSVKIGRSVLPKWGENLVQQPRNCQLVQTSYLSNALFYC